jgi:hypothetical protein
MSGIFGILFMFFGSLFACGIAVYVERKITDYLTEMKNKNINPFSSINQINV